MARHLRTTFPRRSKGILVDDRSRCGLLVTDLSHRSCFNEFVQILDSILDAATDFYEWQLVALRTRPNSKRRWRNSQILGGVSSIDEGATVSLSTVLIHYFSQGLISDHAIRGQVRRPDPVHFTILVKGRVKPDNLNVTDRKLAPDGICLQEKIKLNQSLIVNAALQQ